MIISRKAALQRRLKQRDEKWRQISLNVYEAIEARRTIRDFAPRPVEDEVLRRIIGTGLRAPTNDHMRSWEFVVVNDPAVRLRLLGKMTKSYTREEVEMILTSWGMTDTCQRDMYFEAIPKQYAMLLNCACLILPFFRQKSPLLKPATLSSLNAFASIWCCIENMLIAAAAEGIHGVTRIPLGDETACFREALGVPAEYELPCCLALGYPADDAVKIRQISIDVGSRIRFDHW